jgi:hypothetical protein
MIRISSVCILVHDLNQLSVLQNYARLVSSRIYSRIVQMRAYAHTLLYNAQRAPPLSVAGTTLTHATYKQAIYVHVLLHFCCCLNAINAGDGLQRDTV